MKKVKKQKQKQSQRQSVVVNIHKPKRSRPAPRRPTQNIPLPPNYIYISPPAAPQPRYIPNALPDTEHPKPLPLAPRVPIRVPTNLADTEHEIAPVSLGGVDRQAELFQEAVVEPVSDVDEWSKIHDQAAGYGAKVQDFVASELASIGESAKEQEQRRAQAFSDFTGIGERAKEQKQRRDQAFSDLIGIGEREKEHRRAQASAKSELAAFTEAARAKRGLGNILEVVPVEPPPLEGWGGSEPGFTQVLVGRKLPPLQTRSLFTEVDAPEPTGEITFTGGGKTARLLKPQTFAEAPKTQRAAILPGESIPQAAARQAEETQAEQVNELEKSRKPKEPKTPDPEWYTAIKKDFRAFNKLQLEEDKKNMDDKAAKAAASKRNDVYKERGELGTFTLAAPEAITAAALKRGFAPVGEKAVEPPKFV